ncbi:MAG: cytidine deaminase [Pyrinomonadaceae bacterium]|nr:cytidine deaminase [Sphingobacteriaceae bacterium]
MIKKEFTIAIDVFNSIEELQEKDKLLCEAAVNALNNSHSPYSNFKVGAAIRLQSGHVLYGSNQENVAYPSGLCAERVALFHAGANYPDDAVESIAITAQTNSFEILNPITPCGSCLQVLAEYEKKQKASITVLMYCINGQIWKGRGIETFLPFLFFEDKLAKQ